MLTDTYAKFEVKSLASIFAIKKQSLVADSTTNARKTGQLITIGNCERISEALAITCEKDRFALSVSKDCRLVFENHTNEYFHVVPGNKSRNM